MKPKDGGLPTGKLDYHQWYWDAWFSDAGVMSLNWEERARWHHLLGLMHFSPMRGCLCTDRGISMDDDMIADVLGMPLLEWSQLRSKLLARGVASYDDQLGCLYNRKMRKAQQLRDKRRFAGSQGGKQKASKQGSKPLANSSKPTAHAHALAADNSSKKDLLEKEGGVGGDRGVDLLEQACYGLAMEWLEGDLGLDAAVAMTFARDLPIQEIALVHQAAQRANDPAGWARTALEGRWKQDKLLPPDEAAPLVQTVRDLKAAAAARIPSSRPSTLPPLTGDPAKDEALMRKAVEDRRAQEGVTP